MNESTEKCPQPQDGGGQNCLLKGNSSFQQPPAQCDLRAACNHERFAHYIGMNVCSMN